MISVEKVWYNTQKFFENISVPPSKIIRTNMKYVPTFLNPEPAQIFVVMQDTLDTSLDETDSVMLNMACASHPGGNPKIFGAQEEDLFRRTSLSKHLKTDLYPIPLDECILSTNVIVIKNKYRQGYKYLENPRTVDIISCPAINMNGLIWTSTTDDLMYRKIWTIFQCACMHGYKVLVLSAFGCGGYNCDPEKVAEIFKKVLSFYRHCFKKIIFAITDIENHPKSNFNTFKRIFS